MFVSSIQMQMEELVLHTFNVVVHNAVYPKEAQKVAFEAKKDPRSVSST